MITPTMKILKIILFCILVTGTLNGYSQDVLCGKIVNQQGDVLYPANIRLKNTQTGTTSGSDGLFCLNTPRHGALIVSFIGYYTDTISFDLPRRHDSLFLITLRENPTELDEIEIHSRQTEVVTREEGIWVTSYEIWNKGLMLLHLNNRTSMLSFRTLHDSILWQTELTGSLKKCNTLYKDFRSNLFLVSEDSAFQISDKETEIYFFPGISITDFNLFITPSLGMCSDTLIYRLYGPHNKSVFYYRVHAGVMQPLYSRTDPVSERRCEDFSKEISENLSSSKYAGEAFSGPTGSNSGNNDWRINLKVRTTTTRHNAEIYTRILSKPIDTHFFSFRDTLYIFDYVANLLTIFNCPGQIIREQTLSFPKTPSFLSDKMIVSESEKDFYAFTLQDGQYTLHQINIQNGQFCGTSLKIPFPFVEKMKVYQQAVYFLYKPKGTDSRKRLYKLDL